MSIDSRPATYEHIEQVRALLNQCIADLLRRAHEHDRSKVSSPEREMFDDFTERLEGLTYGTPEYEATRQEMLATALGHHYAHNDHHPEHFVGGFADMHLLQVIELLADWKAATLRHADGDLDSSITKNAERFGYGPEIERLLRNTASALGWL